MNDRTGWLLGRPLAEIVAVTGVLGAAVVDAITETVGWRVEVEPGTDIWGAVGEGIPAVVRACHRLVTGRDRDDEWVETVFVDAERYHLLRSFAERERPGLVAYVVLDRRRANLSTALRQLGRLVAAPAPTVTAAARPVTVESGFTTTGLPRRWSAAAAPAPAVAAVTGPDLDILLRVRTRLQTL